MPWLEGVRPGQPGHPLYVPARQRAGRLDNPDHYRVLYVADSAVGAIAEAFGSFELWTPAMLSGPPGLPGSRRALVGFQCPDDTPVLNVDDAAALLQRDLRPSEVVTRSREVTQAWALGIFEEGRFAGVRWWSYYNPDWGSIGLWDQSSVAVESVQELTEDSAALQRAREVLMRSWVR
ncbi:MAG TPA: RES family NAD+ phosphorylase [Candidatus Dormibacteraeota bacterium]